MIALSFGQVLVWIGGLAIFAAVGWLIVWLIRRGHASPGDFFP